MSFPVDHSFLLPLVCGWLEGRLAHLRTLIKVGFERYKPTPNIKPGVPSIKALPSQRERQKQRERERERERETEREI